MASSPLQSNTHLQSFNLIIIHALNVNSLVSKVKRHHLQVHLFKYKPDVMLLSETCLRKVHKLSFPNYNLIRTDKESNSRGTAILIKNSYKYKQIILPNLLDFEYTAISLRDNLGRTLYLFSIYVHAASEFDQLGKCFDVAGVNDFIICGGDFNARHTSWSNDSINVNGLRLFNWLNNYIDFYNLKFMHSLLPSRYDATSHSFIDLFIFSSNLSVYPNNITRLNTHDYESDHRAVVLSIMAPILELKPPTFISDFSRANWKNLAQDVDSNIHIALPSVDRNLTNAEIDVAIDALNNVVTSAMNLNIPKIKINPSTLIKLNPLTNKLLKEKKLLRRRWFNSGRSNNTLKSLILRLSVLIKELINNQYSKHLENIVNNIKPGPNLFKQIRRISGYRQQQFNIHIDGCLDDVEAAESLADYFESIHSNSPAALDPPITEVKEFIGDLSGNFGSCLVQFSAMGTSDKSSIDPTQNFSIFKSPENILQMINGRKNIKSSGFSKIPNIVLRKLPLSYARCLSIIINNSLNNSYFPSIWKQAIVVPVPKKSASISDRTQFRPISLLSCEGKIFELVIKEFIDEFISDNNINNVLQFGFTREVSTAHALTFLMEHVHMGFVKKEPMLALSLDLQKAFDTVWIEGLIFKLRIFGFPLHICGLLLNYLSDRKFKVKIGDDLSSFHGIKAGVPQGAILAPSLFNLFIADFPVDWQNGIKTIFFADDILMFKSRRHVGLLLDDFNAFSASVHDFLVRWKLVINYNKCESILFRKYEAYIPNSLKQFKVNENVIINLGGHRIVAKDQIKYLGIVLDKKCSVVPHVRHIIHKANGAFALLRGIFNRKALSTRAKTTCFKQLIRPILSYGFIAWSSISSHQMALIRSLERKILYKCLPISEAYFYDTVHDCHKLIPKIMLYDSFKKTKRFDIVAYESAIRFMDKLKFSPIEVLKNASSEVFLNETYDEYNDKYTYKSFPPSFLYYLHINRKTCNDQNVITFYNRRFNSNLLDDYVYDLANPS